LVKTVTRIVGLLILLGLGWLGWQHLFPNEERRVRRTLDDLAGALSISASESIVGTGLAVDRLLSYATLDIEVEVDVPGEGPHTFSGREEIRDAALAARRNLGEVKVQFLDVDVALAGDKQTATVELTVKATQPGAKEFFVREMKLQLRKQDSQWRISRAETVKPLKL
jgi:ketosteroid isomerase-like protein